MFEGGEKQNLEMRRNPKGIACPIEADLLAIKNNRILCLVVD